VWVVGVDFVSDLFGWCVFEGGWCWFVCFDG